MPFNHTQLCQTDVWFCLAMSADEEKYTAKLMSKSDILGLLDKIESIYL